ncbi:alpha/beta hydrolase [Chitinivorax sp. B]|uniref:alpha/beta fold hydrolase n=1 Tax=Chitinivorax sp. B TaxID=2502235 RepID=UPI0010F47908|nr:alpha/beta hydrolase [Chitinivorax sp. B]
MKSSALGSLLVAFGMLLQGCSSGTKSFTASAGRIDPDGIAYLEPVTLGGHQQWLLVRGANKSNPILLFLHGGPGSPYIGLAHKFQHELEKHFVVVQWDQRGSGKSFPDTPPGSMTVNQFHADTHELVLLLRQQFNRDKIYLLGHSWGSYLGIVEAKHHPENLYAYIGAGQMIDLVKQEQLSHDFVTERAKADGNEKALKQLNEIGYPPYKDTENGMNAKYSWLWEYGGMLDNETGPSPFVKALLTAKEYSLMDISRFVRGGSFSLRQFADNEGLGFWKLKVPDAASGFQVPIFFVTGEHDRVTPLSLIENYTKALHAPMKQSVVINNTGHFAFFAEPRKFSEAIIEVRNKTLAQ